MKSIKELIKGKTIRERADYSEKWLIEHGYIYTEAFGWEKPEYLERFGLNPNANAIPGQYYEDFDIKETKQAKTDFYGNKTGEYEIKVEKIPNGKHFLGASQNYLNFRDWKRKRRIAWDLEDEARNAIIN